MANLVVTIFLVTCLLSVSLAGDRKEGQVKWFNDEKGFGFITPSDGSEDIYVHFSGLASEGFRTLKEGQKVSYVVVDGNKGPTATSLQLEPYD